MDERCIIRTMQTHEDQILSMKRELRGVQASITAAEHRIDKTRVLMIGFGIAFILVAVWLWLSK